MDDRTFEQRKRHAHLGGTSTMGEAAKMMLPALEEAIAFAQSKYPTLTHEEGRRFILSRLNIVSMPPHPDDYKDESELS